MSKSNHIVRTPYNYSRDSVSSATSLVCNDVSRTHQHMKNDSDINVIVRNFGVSGSLPVSTVTPSYGDFTGVSSYHEAMNIIATANETFDSLPAHLRKRFDNNPQSLVNFLRDADNYDEAVNLGLIDKKSLDIPTDVNDNPNTPPSDEE